LNDQSEITGPTSESESESLDLLADVDPDEAQGLVPHARATARTRAVAKANAHLKASGSAMVAHEETAMFNPVQRLWIIAYRDPAQPDEILCGGPLIVPARGMVYQLDSLPNAPEFDGIMAIQVPVDWADLVDDGMTLDDWDNLQRFVAGERDAHKVYPAAEDVFRAFDLTHFDEVRVVILGQDPYFTPGHATGLAFSVPSGVIPPPSLRTILAELRDDLGVSGPTDLTNWARQGVLLLNTALTVRAGDPNSHATKWEVFTNAVIRQISEEADRVVFVLWGESAQKRRPLIDSSRHEVIEAAHPNAWANALVPLRGSKPFSRINALVKGEPIDWSRA
jgi:uracil-DNA glycosylase